MAPPAQPYIDIVTGTTYGDIDSPGTFSWYNSKPPGPNSSCTVTGTGNWCTSSSYGPIGAQAWVTASVLPNLASANYRWDCPCCMLGSPSSPVHGLHPKPTKK